MEGVLAFSAHNLDDKGRVFAFDKHDINPVNNARNVLSFWKVRQNQERTETYEIVSDPLGGFGHMAYYIRKPEQVMQLEEIGFQDIAILDRKCQFVEAGTLDQESEWLHYVCRKLK